MATIVPTLQAMDIGVLKVTWASLVAGDDGAYLTTAGWKEIILQIIGTATVFAMQGTHETGDKDTPVTLQDDQGTDITAAGVHVIVQTGGSIRPFLTTGDVTVIAELRK